MPRAASHSPAPVAPAAVQLIKDFESFVPHVYTCPAGHPTIGYGHVLRPGERFERPLSEGEATALLKRDLREYAAGVDRLVRVDLNEHERGALVSFAYNVGVGALASSTLLRRLNAGDRAGAADQFLRWTKARVAGRLVELRGLVRRRRAERALFLSSLEARGAPYPLEPVDVRPPEPLLVRAINRAALLPLIWSER